MKNWMFFWVICCFLSFSLLTSSEETAPPIEKFVRSLEEIDFIVNQSLDIFDVPGAAVGIVVDDQAVLTRGYGTRQVNEKLPVTERTLFPIASCTKAFTAMMMGQLVDEGKVTWDDPVQKHIPEFGLLDAEMGSQITIRDLLAHRTGMARHDPIWFFANISRSEVVGILQHLESASGLRQVFQYNNFMYSIAGIIIERITGQTWEEAVSDRLLKPLEMNDSNETIAQLQSSHDYSYPHAEIKGNIQVIPFRDPMTINPGGGINSNILDMTKWVQLNLSEGSYLNQRMIEPQTFKEMQTIQMPFPIKDANEEIYQLGYGLGWFISHFRGHTFVSHRGHLDGFVLEVAFLPESKFGLVILTNSGSSGQNAIQSIRNQIFDKVLGLPSLDWVKKFQEIHEKSKDDLDKALQLFDKDCADNGTFQSIEDYVGIYEHPAYGIFEIKNENNHLIATYGEATIPLHYKTDNILTGRFDELLHFGVNPMADFSFFRNDSGYIDKVHVPFEAFRLAKPITFLRK